MEYGNLAVKDYKDYTARKRKPQNKKLYKKIITRERDREQTISMKKNIHRMCAVAALSVSAIFMITQFVAVRESSQEIKSLTRELTEQSSITSQKVFALEQSIDLDKIEKIATTKLGMQRPESNQVVYVNVKTDDVTDATADEVEGVGKSIAAFFKSVGSNIVKLFSIE